MSFSLCPSSLENLYPYNKGASCARMNLMFPRFIINFGKKDGMPIMRNVALSGHLVPEHLERSVIGKNKLEEVNQSVEYVRTLLIDNYDSYTYNIYQSLAVVNGGPPFVVRNDEWTWEKAYYYLYEEKAFDNIVISPGPGSPSTPG
ncbi:hypothetical protein Dimus_011450 [Dionaea muscipula]